ncbi:MAG: TlyA family RNA methyltransferase [Candidatus Sungbacteria bacterium]|nr:TlyA family RNA methyltransferase [Candidatus Sungbacteria bacterium]
MGDPKKAKKRLDGILIEKGWARDRQEAFIIVTEGRVFVEGQKATSPAQQVYPDARVEVRGPREFVGRGAYKLEAALEKFKIDVSGKICADIGAATGGFTEVLLKYGARKVYAIDTARGKLAPKLREDSRVAVMEGVDVRDIESLPDPIEIATMDVSLIPLENILPHMRHFLKLRGDIIALFKPQYQTRDSKILRHGVIRDTKEREGLLENFLQWAEEHGWKIMGQMESPIRGGSGNAEYLIWLR